MTFLAKEESGIELYRTLPETHGRRYSAVLYRCTSKSKKKPAFISFVETDRFISKGLLVKSIEIPKRYKHRFTVCLMPLHNNFNDSYALVQWIELNLILGADKFRVYNHSSSQSIKTILDMYSGRNITEVVQWSIPVTDVHYFGQVAALQDCLYQNKADSEFIVNLDLDEYIVPRVEHIDTWSDLIANSPAEAFLFRNTFFVANSREHNYSEKAIAQQLRLSTLLMTRHEPKIWSHTLRSKYIARTSKARSLMIHDVPWDAIGVQAERVQSDRAMVFHFQHAASEPNNGTTYIIDETVRKKYGEMLIRNVQRAWNRILRG
ncbi:hypothetical protein DPMN_172608 [Dreissena polymorpha]|uniref:Glycosyltransferase family 92 protein n=2 Tax=Dreissena polymorpha TaxID=45954 RepID=A0A9D4E048_DREPO|nr:hypothetical protein DPMN_172608 [Dreissena polymorpha]